MSVDPELRNLDIDIPAQPEALVRLSLLLADEEINLDAASELIESDMALAAAVLKAVNSSMYGLKGRVTTVMQAVQYLGMREVAAITFEIGLRAAFAPSPLLEPLWQRAARRGLLMGRMAQFLGLDAWAAHSAGLFEECGKAVLLRHASDHYPVMLRAAGSDIDLCSLERAGFGVSHDALGAALCDSWGLGAPSVASVRYHVVVQAGEPMPPQLHRQGVLALSGIAHVVMTAPDRLEETVARLAPEVGLDETLLLRAARRVTDQLAEQAADAAEASA